ncbi:protein CURLY FLAG LEAF 1-like [Phragmites australis]|uniref:protein CURLY FLAG LEAF 1-like n=1 Tax=Phragmites australis TaxID=29695 RepID=UPI002D77833F|nr:protein CURLY FLAG LEAF 1-like [Phragmites australis]
MVSLQSALLPEAKRPPCLSLIGSVVASTATSKKRKRDGNDDDHENSRGEVEDGIELNFDAAPLPPEWQRCLDIQSGQIHYYNTRTHKRTLKDPRGEPDYCAAPAAEEEEEEEASNCATAGHLDLDLNLAFQPRGVLVQKKRPKPAADRRQPAEAEDSCREMVAAVCVRCHMLVMMCRASPACPNCKFLHPPNRAAPPPEPEPAPLKLGLQLLCCRD